MAVMEVRNGYAGWLLLWLEPLGEDRWLRPDETFRIQTDYQGDEPAFTVVTAATITTGLMASSRWPCG